MAKIVRTFTNEAGATFNLKEFVSSKLYSPNEKRAIKQNNLDYYDAVATLEKIKKHKEAEAKMPKVLSENELWEIAQERQRVKEAEEQAYKEREAAKIKMQQDYLSSTPELVSVCTTNFYSFQLEMYSWQAKGYTIIVDSLQALVPSLFSCQLAAPATALNKKK